MKQCADCLQTLEVSEFYPQGNTKDGLRHICKPCDKKKVKENALKRKIKQQGEEQSVDDLVQQVEDGTFQVDQKWLLKELITQYKGDKVRDKLKALDMIAKVSGYSQDNSDEKAIIASMMESLKKENGTETKAGS